MVRGRQLDQILVKRKEYFNIGCILAEYLLVMVGEYIVKDDYGAFKWKVILV